MQSFDEENGRYNVLLSEAVGGRQWAKVKGEHLRPVLPLPARPPMPPMSLLDPCIMGQSPCCPIFPPTPVFQERPTAAPLKLTALV